MEKSTTLLVGNGPSLLNKKNGDLINGFTTVVRFNSYTTTLYEEYVGSKTDIWFLTPIVNNKDYNFSKVYFHYWNNRDKCFLHPKYYNLKNTYNNVEMVSDSMLTQIKNYSYKATGTHYNFFSTGLIAIFIMLNNHSNITLTGFDWWDPTQPQKHYYDPDLKMFKESSRGHQPSLEKIIIESFKNRINFI